MQRGKAGSQAEMTINQNIKQQRFGARQRQEFTLPPRPRLPAKLLKICPEMADWQAEDDRWRELSNTAIADALLAFSQDVNKAP